MSIEPKVMFLSRTAASLAGGGAVAKKNNFLLVILRILSLAFTCAVITGCITESVYRPSSDQLAAMTITQAEEYLVQGLKASSRVWIPPKKFLHVRDVKLTEKGFEITGVSINRRSKETSEPQIVQFGFDTLRPYELQVNQITSGTYAWLRAPAGGSQQMEIGWCQISQAGLIQAQNTVNALCILDKAAQQGLLIKMPPLEDFYAKANAWRALPQKPPLPEPVRRYMVMAEDCVNSKDFPNAIKNYTQALQLEPLWPPTHYNLAILMGEHGQYDRAIYHMRCYIALQPEAPQARPAQDQIYIWEGKRGSGISK